MSASSDPATPQRGPGRPRRIDREKILEAARGIPAADLTMRTVAERLGVDRKALNYHVSDRQGLLDLLAADSMSTGVAAMRFAPGRDWHDLLRDFAGEMRALVRSLGPLADYSRLDGDLDLSALKPAEAVLESLIAAGFSIPTAGLALANIATLGMAAGRNDTNRVDRTIHPTTSALSAVLRAAHEPGFEAIEAVVDSGRGLLGEAQFEFDLRVALLGLELVLEQER